MYLRRKIDAYLMKKPGVTKNTENWNWIRYMIGDKMFVAVCLDDSDIPYYILSKPESFEGGFFRLSKPTNNEK